jgi:hypothetical protein
MAVPRLGQKRSDGKVYAGENYGYQSPASFSKLKDQGKFKVGAQTLDRATQAVSRVTPKPVKNYANAVQSAVAKNAETDRRNNEKTAIGRFQNRVNSQPSATEKVLKGVSDKTNVDQRIVNTAANVTQAAIAKKVLGGAKPQPLPARSVGAAARADVAGRTVPATRRLPTSARPTGTVRPNRPSVASRTAASSSPGIAARTTAQKAAEAATKAAKNNPASSVRPAPTSGGNLPKGNVARQAAGPRFPGSSGTKLAPGNTYKTTGNPSDRELTRSNKRAAATEYADRVGSAGSSVSTTVRGRYTRLNTQGAKPRNDRGWNETTKGIARQERDRNRLNSFMPDGGRVNPAQATERGIKLQQAEKAGRSRTAARSQARAEVSAAKEEAAAKARAYQRANATKDLKGTTPAARAKMAESMTNTPRRQGPKPPPTTTTGTRRVAANPESGTSRRGVAGRVVQGKDGAVTIRNNKGNLTNNPGSRTNFDDQKPGNRVAGRSTNPATGRPYQANGNTPTKVSTKKPSASTRQPRGGNPAENLPYRSGRAPLPKPPNPQPAGPGFTTRTPQKPGQSSGGIRPVDSRGSTTPLRHQGSSTQDTRQRRTDRSGTRNIGRLGQAGQSNIDTPATRARQAANKARAAASSTPAAKPTAPTRSPERSAQIRSRSRAMSGDMKDVKGLDKKGQRALQNQWEDRLGKPAKGTVRGGEVRLDGSARGGDFVTGINNAPGTGKQSHSGKPSRVIGTPKNQGRSAEASQAAKATLEALKKKRAMVRKALGL